MLNQVVEFLSLTAGPSRHHDACSHGRRQSGFGKKPFTDPVHQKQHPQAELQGQPGRLVRVQTPKQFRQHPSHAGADQDTAAQPRQQTEQQFSPAVQVTENQFEQQQCQNSPDRFKNKAFRFKNIPQWGGQSDLTNEWCDDRWPRRQNNGAVNRSHRPAESRQPVGGQQASTERHQQTQQ